TSDASIALLASYSTNDSALHAISLHRDGNPAAVLARIARTDPAPRTRGKALFWLAGSAQRSIAEQEIDRAIAADPETEVKRSAVFALSRLPN
ncbi:hypothetical protein ACHM19_15505, partial [Clostridium perfringens]|uniref:hypothetical protein n=1 Tax=Clostridium perfringens TaxID=1502 RepID=UPI00375444A2